MSNVRISKKLQLIIPIFDENDSERIIAYAHHAPITSECFDVYYKPISRAYANIVENGTLRNGGARIAAKALRSAAQDLNMWDGAGGASDGLVNEMRRHTSVLHVGVNGWQTIPFELAKKQGVISEEDFEEVESIVTFFTLVYLMNRRSTASAILDIVLGLCGAQTTLLTATEYRNTLPTLIEAVNTGAKTAAA